ncbi:MAG: hypothetical protein AB1545_12555 [Thermodesulfobacteriota bacterium]
MSERDADAVRQLAKEFGRRVVFFYNQRQELHIGGSVIPDRPDVIYIHANTPKPYFFNKRKRRNSGNGFPYGLWAVLCHLIKAGASRFLISNQLPVFWMPGAKLRRLVQMEGRRGMNAETNRGTWDSSPLSICTA